MDKFAVASRAALKMFLKMKEIDKETEKERGIVVVGCDKNETDKVNDRLFESLLDVQPDDRFWICISPGEGAEQGINRGAWVKSPVEPDILCSEWQEVPKETLVVLMKSTKEESAEKELIPTLMENEIPFCDSKHQIPHEHYCKKIAKRRKKNKNKKTHRR